MTSTFRCAHGKTVQRVISDPCAKCLELYHTPQEAMEHTHIVVHPETSTFPFVANPHGTATGCFRSGPEACNIPNKPSYEVPKFIEFDYAAAEKTVCTHMFRLAEENEARLFARLYVNSVYNPPLPRSFENNLTEQKLTETWRLFNWLYGSKVVTPPYAVRVLAEDVSRWRKLWCKVAAFLMPTH